MSWDFFPTEQLLHFLHFKGVLEEIIFVFLPWAVGSIKEGLSRATRRCLDSPELLPVGDLTGCKHFFPHLYAQK